MLAASSLVWPSGQKTEWRLVEDYSGFISLEHAGRRHGCYPWVLRDSSSPVASKPMDRCVAYVDFLDGGRRPVYERFNGKQYVIGYDGKPAIVEKHGLRQ